VHAETSTASPRPAAPPLLDGRAVLVTGGATGLGAAVVDACLAAGARVASLDVKPTEVPGVVSQLVDLADTAAASAATAAAIEELSGLDAVVTCAGIDVPAPLAALPAEAWERVVAVNLFGTVSVVRAALVALEARRGKVVTVASTLGHRAAGDATAYCASKFGVVGFTRALALELRGRVGVTLLTPGGMATRFFDERDDRYKPPPGMALCDPGEVAAAALFALTRPPGAEVKELVVTGPDETSWP
jgi:NAD(P)-dependent dehydrogenase (short-subunit alcohol dehydrogenase family)